MQKKSCFKGSLNENNTAPLYSVQRHYGMTNGTEKTDYRSGEIPHKNLAGQALTFNEEPTSFISRKSLSGICRYDNVGQATPDVKKGFPFIPSPLVGGPRRTGGSSLFPSPLAGEGGRRPGEGCKKGNNFINTPSSVCPDFVRQTTSPARGEAKQLGGFTLIELLVVVLIIGILAAVALPQYKKAVEKSRYATLKDMTQSIANAQEIYYMANGVYSTLFEALDVDTPANFSTEENDTVDIRVFPWGRCQLSTSNVYCSNNVLAYQVYYQNSANPRRRCIAWLEDENSVPAQVCKQETKNTYFSKKTGYIVWDYVN